MFYGESHSRFFDAVFWRLGWPVNKGVLEFGGVKMSCAVLDDGRRVLSEFGITNAILGGSKWCIQKD